MPQVIVNPFLHTNLFKSIAPYINSIHPEVLMHELCIAKCRIMADAGNLDDAFTWCESHQRSEFWGDLHAEYCNNKANRKIVTIIAHLYDDGAV